jgi:hypothetical protein
MGEIGGRAELQRAGRSRAVKLDGAMNPDGGANCRRLIASPVLDINPLALQCLNRFEEAPRAEPHAGCCGDGEGKPPCYPIMQLSI